MRLNLISGPVPPLEDRLWQRLVHEIAAPGIHLEVQGQQRQCEELEPWLLGWPGVVVVDHRGLPAALSLPYPGCAALSRLLAGQYVWAKAAVPCRANGRAYSTPTWLTAELNPTEALRILCANPARLFAWTPFRRAGRPMTYRAALRHGRAGARLPWPGPANGDGRADVSEGVVRV
ncbi:hypothetical protein ACH47C_19995 [Streptomyces rishiriensis]|uniref:hypothetical protein n=1 Tax=Streptomyces rishiriensis TaxID=68264 RepID=UPI0033CE7094